MVSAMDNGRNLTYCKMVSAFTEHIALEADDKDNEIVSRKERIDGDVCSKEDRNLRWDQFQILLMRMWLQMWRDKSYLLLKVVLHICIGLLIGNLYIGMGKDGAKTIFNFGFLFTCIIFFMYVPMMPVLLQCKFSYTFPETSFSGTIFFFLPKCDPNYRFSPSFIISSN